MDLVARVSRVATIRNKVAIGQVVGNIFILIAMETQMLYFSGC